MDKEQIAGMIVMVICCFCCGILFFGIGLWAQKAVKPVHFWSGTRVDPAKVTDINGYNRANGVMWKLYSIPYWVAGILSCLEFLCYGFNIAAAILLFLACFPGLFILVWNYNRIEKRYITR